SVQAPSRKSRPGIGAFWASGCGNAEESLGPYPVEIRADGHYRARVASGCASLSLQTGGFAPLIWPDLRPPAESVLDLGHRKLEPGSALLVRVSSSGDRRPVSQAAVDLFASADVESILESSLRGDVAPSQWRRITGPRGWARFSGLEEGEYVARILDPRQTVPTFTEPFALRAGTEVILDEIEIRPPTKVELTVEDPKGLLQVGERIHIRGMTDLASCGQIQAFEVSAKVPPSGPEHGFGIELPPIIAGSWQLFATRESSFGDPQVLGTHAFFTQGEAISTQVLVLEASYYQGRVTYLEQPVRGKVELIPTVWEDMASSARARTDAEGRFQVALDRPGSYKVRIDSRESELSLAVPEILFESPEIEVEIEVPAGRIEGRVVDQDGLPLSEAVVLAHRKPEDSAARGADVLDAGVFVREDGSFELGGLISGRWTVEASADRKRSRPLVLELSEAEHSRGIELVVESGFSFSGRVEAAGRPVPGARGSILSLTPGAEAAGGYASFVTARDGTFESSLSPGSEGPVNVVVEAAGWPVTAFHRSLPEQPLDLQLPQVGGSVTISSPGITQPSANRGYLALVAPRGETIPLAAVRSVRSGDGVITLPNLAPGAWRLVKLPRIGALRSLLRDPSSQVAEHLAQFSLAPGETVEISLARDSRSDPTPHSETER
ncbi:MAG: carboxypeptidase-like regulatory domain-containing protein, partial [Holophagales bacterium]|nr:carboxypeptidase-like regulatory domain-containing protein [Holophagales bacterium]